MILDAAGFDRAVDHLAEHDPDLRRTIDSHGHPPFWVRPPGFATLVLLVLEQQVSLASARATYDRLALAVGAVDPRHVLATPDGVLRRAGLSRQKERYVRELAAAVAGGGLDLDAVARLSDDESRAALVAQIGIGPWTADAYLLAALRRPDIWPVGDRALQVAAAAVKGLAEVPGPDALTTLAEPWRPWRSVAARMLWHDYLSRRGRIELDPPI
ncbi:MAG: DNA-3-methyladenine glycosylase family protein [Acidimicrobiales bacterium]